MLQLVLSLYSYYKLVRKFGLTQHALQSAYSGVKVCNCRNSQLVLKLAVCGCHRSLLWHSCLYCKMGWIQDRIRV